jgi:hypothetical protein
LTEKNQEQVNIKDHSDSVFNDVIVTALKEGGLHVCASKGFGKSRLLFSMADSIRNLADSRVFIFDGSESWLYGYSKIATFNVNECDISLVSQNKSTEDIETYQLNNFNLVKLALSQNKDLLFRLKTRKPSKRGFFIRQIICYLDSLQRQERAINANHEAKNNLALFIEEAQDCFNSRSTTRLEAEEFLTVFNEARNQKESFFTASQRFNDFSKTIRTKQAYCIGRINAEDINPSLRRIERELKIDLSKMPLRTWIYNGLTFQSPNFIQQNGKPTIINRQLREKYNQKQPLTQNQKWKSYSPLKKAFLLLTAIMTAGQSSSQQPQNDNEKDGISEDSIGDFLALSDNKLIFSEED